eukprot:CAMPEP_0198724792 /NCGR_PEP_ID=MMETSP1475-20131203/2214_1 /TAXON_ID= ORGANISM="Unidentified sp., Strain CCMP1999" /NCGR_SAMPLE_ID=MMETSP1475 /ASSEMBLY_ACC=CAM_ASM_001111 /LENGTH=90 /DNA_ID=CAMNT_0044486415 /DNA_START=71 /DNA_END=343 /DNA_ORIENTATION=+
MASHPLQNFYSQLEHLQSKYVGTGHPDTTKFEWGVNQQRDSISSYLGHPHMTQFFAIAEGTSVARTRMNLLDRMYRPCGEPPKVADEEME